MSELHSRLQELVDAAREVEVAPDELRGRLRGALAARLAAGAAAAAATTATTRAAAETAATAGSGVALAATKWVLVPAVMVAAVGATLWLSPPRSEAPPAPPAQQIATSTPVATPRALAAPAPVPSERGASAMASAAVAATPAAVAGTGKQGGGAADSLAQEVALLRDAQRAVDGGNTAHALGLLARYQREFPRGVLRHEAAAVQVIARCRQGNSPSARAAADSFVKAQPSSPLAERVRRACGVGAGSPP